MKIRFLYLLLGLPLVSAALKYFSYLYQSITFPFDWEPTDGDHLNFAMRMADHQAIYFTSESGHLLSVYNPLYHFLISVITDGTPSFFAARALSSGIWILTILIILSRIKIRRIDLHSLIILNLLTFPPIQGMILDTVQIGPSSLLGLLYLVTGLTLNKIDPKISYLAPLLLAAGIMAGLTYYSKQQGIIVTLAGILFLILKLPSKKYLILFATTVAATLFIGIVLIDSIDGNTFVRSTLLDLNNQIPGYWKLGAWRFVEFTLINSGLLALVLLGIKKGDISGRNLTFWQMSFFIHIPFLLYILRNGGGGPNYFLTFWITIIMILNDSDLNLVFKEKWKIATRRGFKLESKMRNMIYSIVLPLIIVTAAFGSIINFKTLNDVNFPPQRYISNSMKLQDFARNHTSGKYCKILTARNSGVFLSSKCNIDSENVITFQYAWKSDEAINKDVIKNRIRLKQYDLIATGAGMYPPEIQKLIRANYILGIEKEINLNYGYIANMRVFIPNQEVTSE